ncbi:hypothetical protein F4821DRAFT_265677 [Hypoxylon rubiginosum]|uniref:Uncharacterized protein n=1 Tax=Hypoxylon rubiginosum TaxID=110542 RepID=A0ACC0CJN4_9PEZI|nr:hypothetical protein F4821DRAFT_265677 [Hypoxylon rubiginosum]
MAEKSAPSPAQPSITIDAPASAYTPQQEGVTGEKQPQISGLTQEESSHDTQNLSAQNLSAQNLSAQNLSAPNLNASNMNAPNMNALNSNALNSNVLSDDKGPQISTGPNPPVITPLHMLTEKPTRIECPFCRQRAMTRVTKEGTSTQTLAGVVLCLFCVCLACLPCVGGWCENVNIFCSSCNNRVATIPHDGPLSLAPVPR